MTEQKLGRGTGHIETRWSVCSRQSGLSETGTVDPNQIQFAPGAVRIAAHSADIGRVS
ncbi:MAG: hypothetical protein HQ478_09125 [Chloroflexi bacterium]|nr:hypothetical protein [Chloroflexota bacterium]